MKWEQQLWWVGIGQKQMYFTNENKTEMKIGFKKIWWIIITSSSCHDLKQYSEMEGEGGEFRALNSCLNVMGSYEEM
jgi:hypothetical protein